MIGLLVPAGLFGLATVAWPIYLHFRRRRHPRVQTVPSLRIFWRASQRAKRLRIQQLLLLAVRVLSLAALCLIPAQLFWRTAAVLPLPLAGAAEDDAPCLGIVIDDSLSARHANSENSRLELSKRWLVERLAQLPDTAQVAVVPTSFAQASPLMPKAAAIERLQQMACVPEPGNATRALATLAGKLSGRRAAVVVAAPRSEALWPSAEPESPVWAVPNLVFFDTTACRADCYIQSVSEEAGTEPEARWFCRFAGEPAAIRTKTLALSDAHGNSQRLPVSLQDAHRREIRVQPQHRREGAQYALSVVQDYAHPWFSWYLIPTAESSRAGHHVIVVRERDPASLVADQVLTAALLATRGAVPLQHVTAADFATGEDDGGRPTLVIVGAAAARTCAASTRFSGLVERGVRVLCVPTRGLGIQRSDDGATGHLPAWEAPAQGVGTRIHPLRLAAAADTGCDLESLLLLGLEQMAVGPLMAPVFGCDTDTVIATNDGHPVLRVNVPGPGTSVWALGFCLELDEQGAMFHPLLPFLLERILFPSSEANGRAVLASGAPAEGEAVDPCAWFGLEAIDGRLQFPDGTVLPLNCSRSVPFTLRIPLPGLYELHAGQDVIVRGANALREPASGELSRGDWQTRLPEIEVNWLSTQDTPRLLDTTVHTRLGGTGRDQRYDLSPLFAGCVLFFLLMESLLLLGQNGVGTSAAKGQRHSGPARPVPGESSSRPVPLSDGPEQRLEATESREEQ